MRSIILRSCVLCLLVLGLLASVLPASAYTLVDTWPSEQEQPSAWNFSYINNIFADGQGRILVNDANYIKVFTPDGELLKRWTVAGGPSGPFLDRSLFARDSQGRIFVFGHAADLETLTISEDYHTLMFDAEGNYLGDASAVYALGAAILCDLAFDAQDNLVVLNGGERRVKIFDSQGALIRQWDIPRPHYIQAQIDALQDQLTPEEMSDLLESLPLPGNLAVDAQGRVYILTHFSVQIFSPAGELLQDWLASDEPGEIGNNSGTGYNRLTDLVVDSEEAISVVDFDMQRIRKYSSTGEKLADWQAKVVSDMTPSGPAYLCLGPQGRYYVGNSDSVSAYTSEGTFLSYWSHMGWSQGVFYWPDKIARSGDTFYVSEEGNHRVQAFDAQGTPLLAWSQWTVDGTADHFTFPAGLACDSQGNVYVIDWDGPSIINRILVFDSQGAFLDTWDGSNSGPGRFCANGICLDAQDNVYLASQGCMVLKYAKDGTFLSSLGGKGDGDGQFRKPVAVALDSQQRLYALDQIQKRVQVFDGQGQFLRAWNLPSESADTKDLAIDPQGRVHVADPTNHRILVYSSEGQLDSVYGENEFPGKAYYNSPSGLAIDPAGRVYAVDQSNHRVKVFSPEAPPAAADYAGWWWEGGDKPGAGYALGMLGGKLYLAWLGYGEYGQSCWHSALLDEADGGFTGPLARYTGWPLTDDTPALGYQGEIVGDTDLSFTPDGEALLTYTLGQFQYYKTLSRYWDGALDSRDLTGWWADPSRDGMGLFLEARGGRLFAGWYHYREDGTPRWWIAVGDFPDGATSFTADLLEYEGGQSLTGDYQDPAMTGEQGEMAIAFTGDDAAAMTWNGRTYTLQRQE